MDGGQKAYLPYFQLQQVLADWSVVGSRKAKELYMMVNSELNTASYFPINIDTCEIMYTQSVDDLQYF